MGVSIYLAEEADTLAQSGDYIQAGNVNNESMPPPMSVRVAPLSEIDPDIVITIGSLLGGTDIDELEANLRSSELR